MHSTNTSKPIAVVGAGSWGSAVANLLSENTSDVLLYARTAARAEAIVASRTSAGQALRDNITVTNDIQKVGETCDVIFPVVPSANFREMVRTLSPFLKPYHVLIHGTKGFDLNLSQKHQKQALPITREHVRTMSEVIQEESSVVRIGCMAGPNLAKEISEQKPAATVIASQFEEVIHTGQRLLKNERFLVYGSFDLIGTELCGILKNIIAVGAGILNGLNLGENARALLISRGLIEMIHIGRILGGNVQAFLGLAGVGDLVATAGSSLSRNFTVGYRLAKGESIDEITATMDETAEGIKTIDLIHQLAETHPIKSVINELLHKIIHAQISLNEAQTILMKMPFQQEVDFLN